MALLTNNEAYYPATFALMRLYLKSMYYTLIGGTDKNLLLLGDEGLEGEDAWDITKRLTGGGGSKSASNSKDKEQSPDNDPVKWGRQRGQELERERGEQDMDYLAEDFFDGMTVRRQNRDNDEDEDELLETIFLVVLCALISGLVYLRGRYVRRQREDQQEQEGNPMFPLGENFGIER
ncbi:hypothetical protein BN14_10804 [Rhizoctonia solani AG-1 IB]|uniref:Uncharacterized protein n=1 Tax=Thanatephorus cucumeris (strain AG1-IB / isolate 7/3/14) TaxID=1108050 RepID=M5CGT2_THACB|nr:hypothetical protein BN14_10804 [Rhizoctonia solani AG-1 IB]